MRRVDVKGNKIANVGGYGVWGEDEATLANNNADRFRCCDAGKAQGAEK
jgi:hypothetical protein